MTESETSDSGVVKPKYKTEKHVYDIDEGMSLTVMQDILAEEIVIQVEIPVNSYFAFGFGSSLDRCDMILINSDEENPSL